MSDRSNVERLRSESPEATGRIAASLAARLRGGDVVLLAGELGAGKTTFVRGAAGALGAAGPITSPTFAIGNIYAGSPLEIAHVDLYRLDSIDMTDEAVLDDFLGPDRVTFVEWPHDELTSLEGLRAVVTLAHAGGDAREIEIDWRERRELDAVASPAPAVPEVPAA